jgi:hypothetical protein
MNLHRIVSKSVGVVNPMQPITISPSIGSTTGADGKRTPSYGPAVQARAQIQPLQYTDIVQLDGLNIQGKRRALYIDGNWEGIVRADKKGGDLITFSDGSSWHVVLVLESWPDWCKVAVTEQV